MFVHVQYSHNNICDNYLFSIFYQVPTVHFLRALTCLTIICLYYCLMVNSPVLIQQERLKRSSYNLIIMVMNKIYQKTKFVTYMYNSNNGHYRFIIIIFLVEKLVSEKLESMSFEGCLAICFGH